MPISFPEPPLIGSRCNVGSGNEIGSVCTRGNPPRVTNPNPNPNPPSVDPYGGSPPIGSQQASSVPDLDPGPLYISSKRECKHPGGYEVWPRKSGSETGY